MLREALQDLDTCEKVIASEQRYLASLETRKLVLPSSTQELRALLEAEFRRLAIDSLEFVDFIRKLVPELHVYLVRLCDGGYLFPRAKVKLNLLAVLRMVQWYLN
jgi:hypothetical protein